MKVFEFEKKGFNFKVFIDGENCNIEVEGLVAEARPTKHPKAGWCYKVISKEIAQRLSGRKDFNDIYIAHPTAEESFNLIRKAKIKNAQEKILNAKNIRLHYYFGDWYRVNTIFINNEPIDFGNAGNVFKSPALQKHLEFNIKEVIVDKLDKYFRRKLSENIFDFEIGKAAEIEKLEGITVKYKEYDDLRGKGRYVSEIIFDDFDTLEKYVLLAMEETIEKKEKEEREIKEKFRIAKETGKKVELRRYVEDCNDPHEECNVDIIIDWAMPDGTVQTTRSHTY